MKSRKCRGNTLPRDEHHNIIASFCGQIQGRQNRGCARNERHINLSFYSMKVGFSWPPVSWPLFSLISIAVLLAGYAFSEIVVPRSAMQREEEVGRNDFVSDRSCTEASGHPAGPMLTTCITAGVTVHCHRLPPATAARVFCGDGVAFQLVFVQ